MKRIAVKFYYDAQNGEMSATDIDQRFLRESALLRADVLKDILAFLTPMYEAARDEAFQFKGDKR